MNRHPSSRQLGVTLPELLITMTVLAIIVVVAIPGLNGFIVSSRLTGQSNEVLAGLNLARAEAIRRNQRVIFCPVAVANGVPTVTGCVNPGAGDWAGWMAFADINRSGTFDGADVVVRAGVVGGPDTAVRASPGLSGVSNIVDFRPDGVARAHGTTNIQRVALRFCDTSGAVQTNVRDVSLTFGSRMSIARGTNSTCASPSDPT